MSWDTLHNNILKWSASRLTLLILITKTMEHWSLSYDTYSIEAIYSVFLYLFQAISDLYQRLNNTRGFTPALENVQCQYGVSAAVMDNITNFLQEQYNVEDRLQFLNSLPQYKTQIQGLNIHFVHIKPKNENNLRVIPILILHGWPSSVGEYYEFASFLSTNQDIPNVVFELIMPSIPGFG